jgi:glyoxylase-like metal-dependent hydrolase (beta-lactamase superfamily II)
MGIVVEGFFDSRTSTVSYVIYDSESRDAVVIDTVLDYDPAGSEISTESVERVIRFVEQQKLKPWMVLETHAHADHLSGAQLIKTRFPSIELGAGSRIVEVQQLFKSVFDLPVDFPTDGRQFDILIEDGQNIRAGSIEIEAIATPGHTPACTSYRIQDCVFTGDALFMPDFGTGRCDFPGGSALDLYLSITERLYALPEETRVFVGHDYQPGGREVRFETTIGEQKRANVQLPAGADKETFVAWRTRRDESLTAPRLLFQSIQVNVAGGALPAARKNDVRYLMIPINVFRPDLDPTSIVDRPID